MNTRLIPWLLVLAIVVTGCEQNAAVVSKSPVAASKIANRVPAEDSPIQEQEEKKSAGKKLFDIANKLLDEKAKSGSDGAKKVQEMMGDKFSEFASDSGQIADDAAKWATDAFKSLKAKGLTSASNPKDWLTEDIRNMNALKYKVVKISMDDLDNVEDQLNRLGELRWDCFHAVEKDGETILFFKKEKRSILKNIPVKDMLKLVPLMNDGG